MKDPLSSSASPSKTGSDFYDPLSSGSAPTKKAAPQKTEPPKAKLENPLENSLSKKDADPLAASKSPTSSLTQSLSTKSSSIKTPEIPEGNRRPTKKLEEGNLKELDDEEIDDENEKIDLEELNTAALGNLWKEEIRASFLKVFDPKKLENLKIRNVTFFTLAHVLAF